MRSTISFASLTVRDIVGIKTPGAGRWSWIAEEVSANALEIDDLVFDRRPERGDAAQRDALESAFVDEDAWLVGWSGQQRYRELFAVVSEAALDAGDFTAGGDADGASGSLFKLSDMAYGSRANSLSTENGGDDPVLIRSHGKLNNDELGFLDGAGKLLGVGFDDKTGFGVDDGPSGGAKWIRAGSAIDFTLTGDQALTGASFIVSSQGSARVSVAFDADGTTAREGGEGEPRFVTDAAFALGGVSEAGGNLPGVADGDRVDINLVTGDVTVTPAAGGAAMTVEAPELVEAAAAADQASLTIGAPAWQRAGFGIRDLALETATRVVLDFDDLSDLGADRERKIPDGYGGFDWTQTGVFETGNFGLNYAPASGRNVAFIAEAFAWDLAEYADENEMRGDPVRISREDSFDFLSGAFTAQGRGGMMVRAEGWRDGVLVETETFALGPLGTIEAMRFGFENIDELRFNADDGDASTNDYFGFDDLVFLV